MLREPDETTDRQPADPAQDGFTLIELMVAISILGLIATAITALILMTLRTAHETELRVTGNNAAMVVAMFFRQDVEGADTVKDRGDPDCPPDGNPGSNALVVELIGTDASNFKHPRATAVSYVLTDQGRTLVRFSCLLRDDEGVWEVESELVVAEGLNNMKADFAPKVRCEAKRGDATDCADNSRLVTLTLTMAGSPRKPSAPPPTIPIIASRRTS